MYNLSCISMYRYTNVTNVFTVGDLYMIHPLDISLIKYNIVFYAREKQDKIAAYGMFYALCSLLSTSTGSACAFCFVH